ncbi:hypothetical protein [Flavobacterium taihuense]|uniref:HNH nuclease domain-containing protein n=1 Tax=Flavobacterium taihuense TaxID=2857508 RepID=A0ABS6XYV3_9FLAO|nr:hypothetical protein [Flavobacterium taihuense]MBW4361054.1 hypothetical protein [Flavobacterium taihuense]
MINIDIKSVYNYTNAEKNQLKRLRSKYGRKYQKLFGSSKKRVWYDGEQCSLRIKHNVVKSLLASSKFKCVYCGKRLIRSGKPVDHFLPNSIYPNQSFHPLNLLPSCDFCNSTLKKAFDPLVVYSKKYSKNIFSIVHPIIEDVDQHIFYTNNDRTILDIKRCTIEGLTSIEIFRLHTFEMQMQRINQHIIDTINPLTNDELIRLVNECATYQINQ